MRLRCFPSFLLWVTSRHVNFAVKGLCALFSVKAGPHTISTIDEKKFGDCYCYDMETQERMSILSWETTLAATKAEMARLIALIIIFKSCDQ